MMKIVITGAAGYLGSSMTDSLKETADIKAFDNLIYDQGTLVSKPMLGHRVKFFKEDINKWSDNLIEAIEEADVIIPLAALVGAPLCDKHADLAIETNYKWFEKLLGHLSSQTVIYPNTNSGYGTTGDEVCTEETPSKPISLYAKTKQDAEDLLLANHSKAICFRLATVFGWSYRPRTDLLVNNLTKIATESGNITVFDGHFRRNYIHVQDVVGAFMFAINNQAPMYNSVYNLGNDSLNMTKSSLVEKICSLTGASFSTDDSKTDPDKRDYVVSSQKLYDLGFECRWGLERGVRQMEKFYNLISEIDYDRCRNY